MAARMPKLSKEAMLRIVETSQAEGLSPDAVILKFLPAPTKSRPESAEARINRALARANDPKAVARAEKHLKARKPIVADEAEAGRLADRALRNYRDSKKKR